MNSKPFPGGAGRSPRAFLLLPLFALAGCAHAPQRAIVLPTTAAIRAPLVAAQAHVARSVTLGAREQVIAADAGTKGIAAGSEEARELSTLLVADSGEKKAAQDQLAATLYQAGELDQEQVKKQAQIDALAKDDAAKTARIVVVTRREHDWRDIALLLLGADFFIGGVIQSTLRAVASFVCRAFFAFGRHLIAFWPVLLAL